MGVGGARGHLGKLRSTRAMLLASTIGLSSTGDSAAAKMVVLAGAEEEGIGDGFLWSKGEIKLGETLLVP